jgi:hypothetical protein
MGVEAAAAIAAACLALAGPAAAKGSTEGSCSLRTPGSERATARDCAACHRTLGAGNHAVDLDYAEAAARSRGGLRPLDEAVRRGAFLPEGRVQCVTCHDARSPWADHVSLPPRGTVRPAVNPDDPATYDDALIAAARAAPLRRGAAVSPKPLCMVCHTIGD